MMIVVLSLLAALVGGAASGTVSGVVQDPTGAAVPGASIIARTTDGERRAVSGADGKFSVESPAAGDVTLVVRAPGFAEKQQTAVANGSNITVVLEPAGLREDVTVTAGRTEQRLSDVSASVSVLRSDDIKQSPAIAVDDVLRQLPTFSL